MNTDELYRDRSLARRLVSVPAMLLGTLGLGILVAPLWLLLPLTDRMGRRVAGCARGLIFLHQVMLFEVGGMFVAGWLWLQGRSNDLPPHWALQRWWGHGILGAAQRRFRLKLTVTGEQDLPDSGPFMVLVRHSSQVDTLLPAAILCHRRHWLLRWVLKKELLWQPCLDIVGNRLPNLFAHRNATRRDLRAIKKLAQNLETNEGVLIYPEGTRFSHEKRQQVLESLKKRSDETYAWASSLKNVLPPRLGGTLTLLREAPTAHVIVMAHRGLEAAGTLGGVVGGRLLDGTVEIRLQAFSADQVPRDRKTAEPWLQDLWSEVDRWVGEA